MRISIFNALLALLLLGCGGQKSNESDAMSHYFAIKDALVKTNPLETTKAAKAFLEENTNPSLKTSLQMIAGSMDVAYQRKAFEQLSKDMYYFVQTNDVGITVYKQFCPMAFDYKGAYWLAKEEQVNNPYFGDLMLHCGHVDETISQ